MNLRPCPPTTPSAAQLQRWALQRHSLVWLRAAAWPAVLNPADADESWDAEATSCLQHWAEHDLPLVVPRQPRPDAIDTLVLGLSAPTRWNRRRLFVSVRATDVDRVGGFPEAALVTAALPAAVQPAWTRLCAALDGCGVNARVYGSHGWQALSGLPHTHAQSDLDLLLPVAGVPQADAVMAVLADAAFLAATSAPRLDGELVFRDGAAVAWREWQQWRARGSQGPLLVKRLHGAALEGLDSLQGPAA